MGIRSKKGHIFTTSVLDFNHLEWSRALGSGAGQVAGWWYLVCLSSESLLAITGSPNLLH